MITGKVNLSNEESLQTEVMLKVGKITMDG